MGPHSAVGNPAPCGPLPQRAGQGVRVWRPVPAEEVAEGEFLLGGAVPDDEQWEFEPGSRVRCVERAFSDGSRGLVAVERLRP